MINLIPDQIRINNRYALRNVKLIRYTVLALLTMAVIVAITGLSILNMERTENKMQQQSKEQHQKLATYKATEDKSKELSDEVNTINTLLSRQLNFSELLPNIAQLMPPGAVLGYPYEVTINGYLKKIDPQNTTATKPAAKTP
jgi:hypothetical protein